MKKHLLLTSCLLMPLTGFPVDEIFTANADELDDLNAARVRINATFDDTLRSQNWVNRGNAGIIGDGTLWAGHCRFMMEFRDLYSKINSAGSVTFTTGILQKKTADGVDPENGGSDVDVYLALDPDGNFWAGGAPTIFSGWDWANEFGWGYENTVFLGRVPQSHPMQTNDPLLEQLPVDDPAMNLTWDITSTLKDWIAQGLLTENSSIAVGFVQRWAEIVDAEGNPKFDDPNLYIKRMNVFEVGNAYLRLSDEVSGAKGPGAFAEYDLQDGWVNAEGWLGWTEVSGYPWAYVDSLNKYVWITEPAGWLYISK